MVASRNPQTARFCWQYLQLEQSLDFPDGELLRDEAVQETIYQQLFAPNAPTPLPPARYRLRVLKELTSRIESAIEDWETHGISDNLMDAMAELVAQPLPSEAEAAQERCYVTYYLSLLEGGLEKPHITLLESRSLISASGTTGLRTWEAALHLGQFLSVNSGLVKDKRVLELGTGTGYLAVLCAKYLGTSHVIASDGSEEVVEKLSDNLFVNGLQDSDKVQPMELKWGHALLGTEEEHWNGGRKIDVVLGADITYDVSVIPALIATLEELVDLYPGISIIIAATERNRETYETFLAACGRRGFSVTPESFPVPSRAEQKGPFYKDGTPIHICQLRR